MTALPHLTGMKTITRKYFVCERCRFPFDPMLDLETEGRMEWVFHSHYCKDQWMDAFRRVVDEEG